MPRLVFCLLLAVTVAGCSAVSSVRDKALVTLGNVAARAMTATTDDLSTANFTVVTSSNLYPGTVGTIETNMLKDEWIEGGEYVQLTLLKRQGIGMLRLDGEVAIDGTPVNPAMGGTYVATFPDAQARTVTMTSATGQTHSVRVEPRPPVRVVSVNGQGREGATVDLGGPLTLELDRQATDEALIRIRLLGNAVGVRTFQEVLVVPAADRIELPADWARHTLRGREYDQGASWLLIEEFAPADFGRAAPGGMQIANTMAADAVPVNVTGRFDRLAPLTGLGISTSGTFRTPQNDEFKWFIEKPTAFSGNALLPGTSLGLVTFTVRATELEQSESSTSRSTIGGDEYVTTTTRTRRFAQLPDAFWNALIEGLHGDLLGAMQDRWAYDMIPVAQVTASPRYQAYRPIAETNTAVAVERTYRGLRTLFGQSVGDLFTDTSGPFAAAEMELLMDELGVDGLVAMTLDLQMPFEEFSLTPRLRFYVFGREPAPGVTGGIGGLYAQGWIEGRGLPVTNEMLDDVNQLAAFLPTAINQPALVEALGEAFAALQAKEAALPTYRAVWAGR